jgi:hypothetical protein
VLASARPVIDRNRLQVVGLILIVFLFPAQSKPPLVAETVGAIRAGSVSLVHRDALTQLEQQTPSPGAMLTPASGAAAQSFLGLASVAIRSSTSRPAPTPLSALAISRGLYGPGIAADTLANTQLGGTDCRCGNSMTSYRFRAVTTSGLASVRIYIQDGSGYSAGGGGLIDISVQTDDGSASHRPSGRILASTTLAPGNPTTGTFPSVSFGIPPKLTSGRLYHLVFRNIDPQPTANFVSLNALFTYNSTILRQPAIRDVDWAQLLDTGNGWKTRPKYTPIAGLRYSNGVEDGVGYIEVWGSAQEISGPRAVREVFTLRTTRSIESVSIRVRTLSGPGPLDVQIETREGQVLAKASISAAAVGSGWAWEQARFLSPVVLPPASSYRLVLTAPPDSRFAANAIRKGVEYGFGRETYFPYGYAQYTAGSGWIDFESSRQGDLQFYFQ